MTLLCFSGATQTPVATLADCLAIDPAAFVAVSASTLATQPTLQDIFTMPIASDLAQMWSLGFSLPVICYLTAWGYGVVINWFNERHDHY
ncbi:MAG: hypothetical protein ACXV74_01850 [Methylobacter sp.]